MTNGNKDYEAEKKKRKKIAIFLVIAAMVYALLNNVINGIGVSSKYSEKNILIVCHADIMKAIECYANGMMSDDAIGPYPPDNASVLEYNL